MQDCASNHTMESINLIKFGVHTLEFTLQLNATDFNSILKTLYLAHSRISNYEMDNGCVYNSAIFSDLGVQVILKQFSYTEQEFLYCALVLVVNPRILMGEHNYIGIYESTPEANHMLISKLNMCLQRLGLFEYYNVKLGRFFQCKISEFAISRLDLCTNYKFESDFIASSYLKLLRRGNRCRFLQESTYYDKTSHRCRPYSDALILHASSFDISIYNKYRQMKDNIRYFKTIPAEADGLLRFEMQLHPAKLRNLLKKVPGIGLADLLSYTQDLCRMEFKRYTKTLFCSGDYYTLNVACELVRERAPTAQAIKMIQFLKDVSVNKSLCQTIKEYQREGRSCRYLLEGLARLGINPVTIPEKWFGKRACLESIPNLFGFCSTRDDSPAQELRVC